MSGRACRRCGKAIEYRRSRFAWIHVTAGADHQLQKDLEYWSVAKVDHAAAFAALTEQRFGVGELYKEANAWVDLIADELHARRHRELE